MERVRTQRFAETVGRALEAVPPSIMERIGVAHFEGDPHFAGLLPWWSSSQWNGYIGGDPEGSAPCVRALWIYPSRTVAYVSRVRARPAVVLHELGHALHYWLWGRAAAGPLITNFTDLKPGDYGEQFAEAFVTYCLAPELRTRWDGRYDAEAFYRLGPGPRDNRTLLALFNDLAGAPAETPPRWLSGASPVGAR